MAQSPVRLFRVAVIAIFASGGCGTGSTDPLSRDAPVPIGKETHDNQVILSFVDLQQYLPEIGVSFEYNGAYSISEDQPWDGVNSSVDSGTLDITAVAGRHQTSGPAQWFDSQTGASNHVIGRAAYQGEMNFAFCGELVIDDETLTTCFGQGSSGGDNIWAVGGPLYATNPSDETEICAPLTGYQVCLSEDSSGDYEFSLTSPDYDPGKPGTTMRANKIAFNGGNDYAFQYVDHTISAGQPWGGVAVTYTATAMIFNVLAGRHKTEAVSQWWDQQIAADQNGKRNYIGDLGFGLEKAPAELNFAVCGWMYPQGQPPTSGQMLCIAQGSTDSAPGPVGVSVNNNWWLGGKGCTASKVPAPTNGVSHDGALLKCDDVLVIEKLDNIDFVPGVDYTFLLE